MERKRQPKSSRVEQSEAKIDLMLLYRGATPGSLQDQALEDYIHLLDIHRALSFAKREQKSSGKYLPLIVHHQKRLQALSEQIDERRNNFMYERTFIRTREHVTRIQSTLHGEQKSYFVKDILGFLRGLRREIAYGK